MVTSPLTVVVFPTARADDKDEYDTTGKASYVIACKKYDVTPVSYFMRHMQDSELVMKHHGLGCQGTRAISVPLVVRAC